jgi:hypothetical protein
VLQVQQPSNQSRRRRGPAFGGHKAHTHRHAQPLPVDQVGQTHQWMICSRSGWRKKSFSMTGVF